MKYLEFKGYTGSIEYSREDNLLYGKVLGIQDLISFEGKTGKELEDDFRNAVKDYLEECNEKGIQPDRPFKGNFNVRIPSSLHREASLMALESGTSLNNLVAEAIRDHVARKPA